MQRIKEFSLKSILADFMDCDWHGDMDTVINSVCNVSECGDEHSVCLVEKASEMAHDTFGLVICTQQTMDEIAHGTPYVRAYFVSDDPRDVYQRILDKFGTSERVVMGISVADNAVIADSAQLSPGVVIGPFCYIGDNVQIGEASVIMHHSIVLDNTIIGQSCYVGCHSVIGGMDLANSYCKGQVLISDATVIGDMVLIDRPALGRMVVNEHIASRSHITEESDLVSL